MPLTSPGRAPFNELATLLGKLEPRQLAAAVARYPQFAVEVQRGPDAGDTTEDRAYAIGRARFSLDLCERVVASTQSRITSIRTKIRNTDLAKLGVMIFGGILGAATLTALGLSHEIAIRISAIATSLIAVANPVINQFAKRYSDAYIERIAELNKTNYALTILQNQLAAAVAANVEIAEVVKVMEQCNKVALDLTKRTDVLRE